MKSLYESLLDDFDVIAGKQDDDTLEQALIEADKAGCPKLSMRISKNITFSGEQIQERSRVEDGIFKCCLSAYYKYDKYVKAEMDKIKLLKPFDTIWVPNEFRVTANAIDKDIAKTINIYNGGLVLYEVKEIDGVNINLCIDNSWVGNALDASGPRSLGRIAIKNSTITASSRSGATNQASYTVNQMTFAEIPEITNSKIEGFTSVRIYSPSAVKDRKDNKLANMLDPKYKAYYHDTKLGALQEYVKKGDIKTVCAVVNNPRKYKFIETEEQKCMFRMNPSFKLKDLINIDCFDNALSKIFIMDNNVCILFTKDKPLRGSICGWKAAMPWNTAKLPNDNWYVSIVKKH
jgi:hypothetical protein